MWLLPVVAVVLQVLVLITVVVVLVVYCQPLEAQGP
jgi:hypothetical protein